MTRALLVALVLGAAIRAWDLGKQPIWLDEAASIRYAEMDFPDCVLGEAQHPPLYRTLLWCSLRTIGTGDAAVRVLPLLFGVATILAGWFLARETREDAAGPYALLLAGAPFLVCYSRECRGYALLILLAVLATWAFLRLVRTERGHVLYAALSALLLLTHYFGAFVLAAHEIAYWTRCRRRRAAWIAGRLGAALAVLPWVLWLAGHLEMQDRAWILPPWRTLPLVVLRFLLGCGVAAGRADRLAEPVGEMLLRELPVVLPLLLPLLWLTVRGARRIRGVPAVVTAGVLLLPLLVLLPFSLRHRFLTDRYLAFAAPFLLLLTAIGLASLRGRARAAASVATAAVVGFALACQVLAPGRLLGYPLLYGHEQWRDAAAYARERGADRVVYRPEYLRKAFVRYYGDDAPGRGRPGRVALVLSHLTPEEEAAARADAARGRFPIDERYFPDHSGIRVVIYEDDVR